MPEEMTSKERMLTAFSNQQPDRVPVSPDISNMIPAKLTGKPFWDIYLHGDPPLWKAYIKAVKYFKIDGWQYAGRLGPLMDSTEALKPVNKNDKRRFRNVIINQTKEAITVRTYCTTPKGRLWSETIFFRDQPPWTTRKYFKDLEKEFDHLQYFYPDPSNLNGEAYWTNRFISIIEHDGGLGNNRFISRVARLPQSFRAYRWWNEYNLPTLYAET